MALWGSAGVLKGTVKGNPGSGGGPSIFSQSRRLSKLVGQLTEDAFKLTPAVRPDVKCWRSVIIQVRTHALITFINKIYFIFQERACYSKESNAI